VSAWAVHNLYSGFSRIYLRHEKEDLVKELGWTLQCIWQMTCHVHCATPHQVLPANTSLINSKYCPCNPKWQAQNVDQTCAAGWFVHQIACQNCKLSQAKGVFFLVLGHIMTRNLNKKKTHCHGTKGHYQNTGISKRSILFFLNTPESCLSFIKEKMVQNQFKPMQKIHKTHHMLKKMQYTPY